MNRLLSTLPPSRQPRHPGRGDPPDSRRRAPGLGFAAAMPGTTPDAVALRHNASRISTQEGRA